MKRVLFILMAWVLSMSAFAQTKLTAAQQQKVVEKVNKSTSAITSMQCNFTQTKSMKMLSKKMQSAGVMYYKKTNKLRWQYTSPYDYTFVLNGDKVHIKSSKSSQKIDVQRNKMFRQITNIILTTITGGSLKSSADFTVEMYQADKKYFARLYPKKKELKQIYSVIEIYFNPELTMVSTVKMQEKTGDVTTVNLINIKTNQPINEKVFSAD
jgi:outer membrane lipoprotein carrier protein